MASKVTDDSDKSDGFDTKREIMVSKLQKRNEDRQDGITRRKEKGEQTAVESESSKFFDDNFSRSREEIEEKLKTSASIEKDDLQSHFDSLHLSVQKLQRSLSESTRFLPAFRVQQSQEIINELQVSIQTSRDKFLPKKKFAFKSKKKTGEVKTAVVLPSTEGNRILQNIEMTECSFKDKTGADLTKTSKEINQKDIALSNLTDCSVKLLGSPGAIHISHLKNCKVLSGPVSGSVFVDECSDCTFVLPCQQLRIHHTQKSNFYIHVTSKAIIEDCQEVRFAPYNWEYAELDSHYSISGLDRTKNNWDDVDDFNWLASDTPSPHWSVLPENDRVKSWNT